MDGTLTQHKSPLEEANRQCLSKLAEKYKLLMIGAGSCERIYRQLGEFPIEIIGNYGMQHATVTENGFEIVESLSVPVDRDFITDAITSMRKEFGFEKFYGDSVEFHASGVITFPILGTAAPLAEKLAFDPDCSKRQQIYPRVCEVLEKYNVFIGGSSSFDITQGEYNKFFALKKYCDENGFTVDEAIFFGDAFADGGNDSHIRLGGADYVEVKDYRNFPDYAAFLM